MPFVVGEQVGAYRIVEQLGQGGMSTVYKAYHAALDRYVALKVLHPVFKGDQGFLQRFQREARIVARLEHPHIVPVYDFSEHEGTPYLVMRYVEGHTLKAVLGGTGVLPLERTLEILRPVCDALQYAHGQGVLHRDVKPSNILLSAEGKVYVTDFGLAKMAQTGDSTISHDRMIGTPQYISPEQAKGEAVDHRTDLYSLGVILFEMVTGRVPYIADTPFAVVHDHIFSPLPLPSRLNPGVPPAVEQVILKALAKSPDDRFQSAGEFFRALEAVAGQLRAEEMAPTAVVAPPPASGPESPPSTVSFEIGPAGAAAAPAAAPPEPAIPAGPAAPAEPSVREAAAALWEAIGSTVSQPLAEMRGQVAAELSAAAAQVQKEVAAARAQAAAGAAAAPEATAGSQMAMVAPGVVLVKPARPAGKRRRSWWILALVGGLLVAALVFVLAVWRPLALRRAERIFMTEGGRALGQRVASRAAELRPGPLPPVRVADAFPRAGEPMPPAEAEQALGRLEGRIAQEPRNPALRLQQGDALYDLQRWPEAAQAYQEAIRLDADLAQAHYNLGTTYLHMDRPPEAVLELQLAVRLHLPPEVAGMAYFNLAIAHAMAGDRFKAVAALQQFLEIHPQEDPWRQKAQNLLHLLRQP